VLRLVALGHTNAEIAEALYVSVRTVETHRAHVQQKLGLKARADLVHYAREHGLLADGDHPAP
jgi:two-component system, NarL family, response regulator NreC